MDGPLFLNLTVFAVDAHRAGTYELLEWAAFKGIRLRLERFDKVAELIEQTPAVAVFFDSKTPEHRRLRHSIP